MTHPDRICAMCSQFSTKDHPDQATQGIGLCTMPTGAPHISPFVAWDGRVCVLFARAADRAPRERFVAKQMAKQEPGEVT